MKKKIAFIKKIRNPFLLFFPFFLLYIAIVMISPTTGTYGDENRYLMFAHNLINGFYSPPPPFIDLGYGPGYPIVLVPFLSLHLPLICITLLNAVFYYLSIILLFKSLQQIVSFRISIIFSLFWALRFDLYKSLPVIYTETFTIFLISLLIFNLQNAFKHDKSSSTKGYIILSGFILGYLALTKVIFGYVIMFIAIGILILLFTNLKSLNYKKSALIIFFAFLITTPYLIYTYNLTGKVFYWGSSGGNNLYWMTTPYEGEYGDWHPSPGEQGDYSYLIPGSEELIKSRHQKDFKGFSKYSEVEKDMILKKIAINNIKTHPLKFLQNAISNVGRMVFNYPASYTLQKPSTLARLPLNGILIVFVVFSSILTLLNWRKILFPIRFLLILAFVYFGGSIFGSAESRMFTMIVPILLLWIAYILQKSIRIKARFDDDKSLEGSTSQA